MSHRISLSLPLDLLCLGRSEPSPPVADRFFSRKYCDHQRISAFVVHNFTHLVDPFSFALFRGTKRVSQKLSCFTSKKEIVILATHYLTTACLYMGIGVAIKENVYCEKFFELWRESWCQFEAFQP